MTNAEARRRARDAHSRACRGRIEDYAWLTRELRLHCAAAAARLRVTERTAYRYERALRKEGAST